MNLIFRMLWVLIACIRKPDIDPDNIQNRLTMRVLPNDLDINMHMNNGRYLTICDLSRIDIFIRTGLAKAMIKNRWMPIIADHTMTYKRPLSMFQKYDIEMAISSWDEKYFHCEHRFIVNDRIVAVGTSKGVVKAVKGDVVPPLEVVEYLLKVKGREDLDLSDRFIPTPE